MRHLLRRLRRDRRGATAIEYGLIASLIVLAMMAGFSRVANSTVGMWSHVSNKVETAGNP